MSEVTRLVTFPSTGLAASWGRRNGTRYGSVGNETSTPGPKGTVPCRGPNGRAAPRPMRERGPGQDIAPPAPVFGSDIAPAPVFALDIAPAPAPVPPPLPVESPCAETIHSPPRATPRARSADRVPSRRL